jgi:hypothetical protein
MPGLDLIRWHVDNEMSNVSIVVRDTLDEITLIRNEKDCGRIYDISDENQVPTFELLYRDGDEWEIIRLQGTRVTAFHLFEIWRDL